MTARSLTFDHFAAMCRQAEAFRGPLPVHVQFRQRGEVLCGLVLDAKPGHGGSTVDFFQLRSDLGVSWCTHHNVRPCSGTDGRCLCEAEAGAGKRSAAPASAEAAPHGNTGVAG